MIYFTADTHFGHNNIIRHCKRPFLNADVMDYAMIDRWNKVVNKDDLVYHLGDFAFRGRKPAEYRKELNGKIILIKGNHDVLKEVQQAGFESIHDILEVSINGTHLVLCHYAMRVWNRSFHGSLHLYGHSHGTLPDTPTSLDVGVDCWDFRPITLDQIKARMKANEDQT